MWSAPDGSLDEGPGSQLGAVQAAGPDEGRVQVRLKLVVGPEPASCSKRPV